MRGVVALGMVMLLAGCASGPGDQPDVTASSGFDLNLLPREQNITSPPGDPIIYLHDPDVIRFSAPGLRFLNVTANTTFRINQIGNNDPTNQPRWILAMPQGDLDNATLGCGTSLSQWRLRNFATGENTLTIGDFPAGNWSFLFYSTRLTNLTLHVNTTTFAPLRELNGTLVREKVAMVDADVRVESDNAPYRVTFNKTFALAERSLVLSSFNVQGNAFGGFREQRSKIESSDGFVCGERSNDVAQPVTAQALWTSGIAAWLPKPGVYSYAGRFEANSAIGAGAVARADVVPLPDLRPTVPEP